MSSSRPSWDEYFLELVRTVATRATCDRGRSGCVIARDNDILATGYVGAPPGLPHCDDEGHLRDASGRHCVRTLHAEQNAVIRAARLGVSVRDSTVYCTMEPCTSCAMTLIALEVRRVVALNAYHAGKPGRDMMTVAGIEVATLSEVTLYGS